MIVELTGGGAIKVEQNCEADGYELRSDAAPAWQASIEELDKEADDCATSRVVLADDR